jgi:hypothetical protein
MPKKFVVALLTLSALVLLFFIVHGLSPGIGERGGGVTTQRVKPPIGPLSTAPAGGRPDYIERRDASGRVIQRLEFADAAPYPDRVEMRRLRLQLFGRPDASGHEPLTTLEAGRAVLHRRERGGGEPSTPMILDSNLAFGDAALSDGVLVTHQTVSKTDAVDQVWARTDSVMYRQDQGRLWTEDPVEGRGNGVTFSGGGLTALIDPRERHLTALSVHRDADVTLAGEAADSLFQMPGAARMGSGSRERSSRGPSTVATRRTTRSRPATAPASPMRITCAGPLDLSIVDRTVTCSRDVKVTQGPASLTGADVVEVHFAAPERKPRTPGTDPASAKTGTDPNEQTSRGQSPFSPTRNLRAASEQAFGPPTYVSAAGRALTISDPRPGREFTALARQLQVDLARDTGALIGAPLARIAQGPRQDTVLTAKQFRFDRRPGADQAPRDLMYAEGTPTMTVAVPVDEPGSKPRTLTVACDGAMVLDGTNSTADLADGVRVEEKQDGTVLSSLKAAKMTVGFTPTGSDQPRAIQWVTASGGVDALAERRSIRSKDLEMRFASPSPSQGEGRGEGPATSPSPNPLPERERDASMRASKPTFFRATGDVRMTELDTGRRAEAEEVEADLVKKQTVFTAKAGGPPVSLVEPGRTVKAAQRLSIDQSTDPPSVAAVGEGDLRVVETKDRDGRPLEQERVSTIAWQKTMAFSPARERANFDGAVRADLPDGRLTCGRLGARLRRSDEAGRQPMLDVEEVTADDDVALMRGQDAAAGDHLVWNLITRAGHVAGTLERPAEVKQGENLISAPRLDFDEPQQAVTAVGPGRLRIVRRPDTPAADSGAAEPPTDAAPAAPDVTEVDWQRGMSFKGQPTTAGRPTLRVAEFRGDVHAQFSAADLGSAWRKSMAAGLARRESSPGGTVPFSEKSVGKGDSPLAAGLRTAIEGGPVQNVDLLCGEATLTLEDRPDTSALTTTRPGAAPATYQVLRDFSARGSGNSPLVRLTAVSKGLTRRFEGERATYSRPLGLVVIEGGPDGLARFWSEESTPAGAVYQDQIVSKRIEFSPERWELYTPEARHVEVSPRLPPPATQPVRRPPARPDRLPWSRGGVR